MKFARSIVPFAIAAALVSGFTAPASAETPKGFNPNAEPIVITEQDLKEFHEAHANKNQKAESPSGIPLQLDPVKIAACNAGLGDTVIETWKSKDDGDIKFECGDSKRGYVHIRQQHEKDWANRKPTDYGNWDDLMAFASKESVENPAWSNYAGDNKQCYSAQIILKDNNGKVLDEFFPSVFISKNMKRVVTSIPTTETMCTPIS